MSRVINISYPESLANSLKLSPDDFKKEMKMSSLAKLFELGKISSGMASKVLGISRLEFLDNLSKYKVSIFDYSDMDNLEIDISNV